MKSHRILFSSLILLVCSLATGDTEGAPAPSREPVAASQESCASPDIWLINTRHLPCPRNQHGCDRDAAFFRRQTCHWSRSTSEAFLQSLPPEQVLCIYIHGNRMSSQDAIDQGLQVFRRISHSETAMRFVIWSWPSERIHGVVRDAEVKAARADGEGFYVASLLNRLPRDTRTSLIGYSFGARAVTGSLHLLAGGTYCGNSVTTASETPFQPPRSVLLAAAMPNGWISPNGPHRLALCATDQMLSMYNPRDPALKLYRLTKGKRATVVLGQDGISERCLGPCGERFWQCCVQDAIGCSHDLDRYLASPSVMSRVNSHSLWLDSR